MSAAIKIIAPPPAVTPSSSEAGSKAGGLSAADPKGTKLCRNVFIHGYCKHENDGCMFSHPKPEDNQTQAATVVATAPSSAAGSPATSPVIPRSALSVQHAKAPAFVPKAAAASTSGSTPVISPVLSAATPAFVLGGGAASAASAGSDSPARPSTSNGGNRLVEQYSQLSLNAPAFDPSRGAVTPQPITENPYPQVDPYYTHRPPPIRQPLDYHLYTTPLPHITNLHPSQTPTHTFFLSTYLREDLQRRSEALLETSPIHMPGLPDELHVYHSLHPLEPGTLGSTSLNNGVGSEKSKRVFGLGTEVYKAVCELDGNAYVLRRAEGFKIMHDTAFSPIESWRRIRHPNVVSVREAFTTRLFGDNSVIFAYDYHPTARTLFAEHFVPKPPTLNSKTGRLQPQEMHIPERVLWSYTVQLVNALKVVHDEGLAARMVGEVTKILVTGKHRIRINCCGILDVLTYDGGQNIHTQQQSDLVSLGQLLLSLSTLSTSAPAPQHLAKSLDHLSRAYSAEFRDFVLFLLGLLPASNANNGTSSGGGGGMMGPPSGIGEVLALVGGRVVDELIGTLNYVDILESEMTRELENGRLVRLLCKFGFINERPEFDHDPRWSESGDRYILKLFRDMVFHQVDDYNKPVLDLSHVLTCLNKLDAGSDEKVMLMSRDEQSCLVVSYREIKGCVEAAFTDLSRGTSS